MNTYLIMSIVFIVGGIGGFYYKNAWKDTPQAKGFEFEYYYPIASTISILVGIALFIKFLTL